MNLYLDIYQFTHFRKFLDEYQIARSKVEPSFTRTEFCVLLGLEKSRSYFADVIRGKKVSPRMILKFIEILNLDAKESEYFKAMVAYDQAKSEVEQEKLWQNLVNIHPNPNHIVNTDAYDYYSHWYNSALFAIFDAIDVNDDLTPIQKRIFPKVTLKKLEDSLDLLLRLGLIRKNENGFYKPTQERISSGPNNNNDLIKQYQLQCFELSKQALMTPPKKPSNMSTLTFSISTNAYKKLEQELQEFKKRARKIISEDKEKADDVYQMNIHLFSNLDS